VEMPEIKRTFGKSGLSSSSLYIFMELGHLLTRSGLT